MKTRFTVAVALVALAIAGCTPDDGPTPPGGDSTPPSASVAPTTSPPETSPAPTDGGSTTSSESSSSTQGEVPDHPMLDTVLPAEMPAAVGEWTRSETSSATIGDYTHNSTGTFIGVMVWDFMEPAELDTSITDPQVVGHYQCGTAADDESAIRCMTAGFGGTVEFFVGKDKMDAEGLVAFADELAKAWTA